MNDIIDEKTGEIWLEAGEEITCDFDHKSGSITGGNLKTLFDNGVTDIHAGHRSCKRWPIPKKYNGF